MFVPIYSFAEVDTDSSGFEGSVFDLNNSSENKEDANKNKFYCLFNLNCATSTLSNVELIFNPNKIRYSNRPILVTWDKPYFPFINNSKGSMQLALYTYAGRKFTATTTANILAGELTITPPNCNNKNTELCTAFLYAIEKEHNFIIKGKYTDLFNKTQEIKTKAFKLQVNDQNNPNLQKGKFFPDPEFYLGLRTRRVVPLLPDNNNTAFPITRVINLFDATITPPWVIGTGGTSIGTNLASATPVTLADNGISLKNGGAEVIVYPKKSPASKPIIILKRNAILEYGNKGGTPGNRYPTMLLASRNINDHTAMKVSDLKRINTELTFRVKKITRANMSNYDSSKHAALAHVSFTIMPKIPGTDFGGGNTLYLKVPIVDDRYASLPERYLRDSWTDNLIYTIPQSTFTNKDARKGDKITYQKFDLLPYVKKGLQYAWSHGYLKTSTDIDDYYVQSMNLGWEITGAFDTELEIYKLSATPEYK